MSGSLGFGDNGMRGANPFRWSQFDALPKLVRDVMNYAPINLGTDRAWQRMSCATPEQIARAEIAVVRRIMRVETRAAYGPDHPQADNARAA